MSLELLRTERDQGIQTVALTPHFYRDQETPDQFLKRRSRAVAELHRAIRALPTHEQSSLPRMLLGAEVAWVPNMADWPELPLLCYAGTRYLMVELPFHGWRNQIFQELYDLMGRTGLTPVIAHVDRYFEKKQEYLDQLYSMGLPMQISAQALEERGTRKQALRLMEQGAAQLIISDCHRPNTRPVNLAPAMSIVRKKLKDRAEDLFAATDELVRDAYLLS